MFLSASKKGFSHFCRRLATPSFLTAAAAVSVMATLGALASCGHSTETASDTQNLPYPGGAGPEWVYNGPLAPLDKPEIFLSLRGHTVRITGLLKPGFSGTLPYYAVTEPDGARTRIHVTYPVASAADRKIDPAAGVYPFMEFQRSKKLNDVAEWGGFPFLVYNPGREIGFHGPITADGAGGTQWQLRRGEVSHGCNRMQGEHLVEMTHMLGRDMRLLPNSQLGARINTPVHVAGFANDFDRVAGRVVDVDYPTFGGSERPTGTAAAPAFLFPTWDGMKIPRSVCRFTGAGRPKGNECAGQAAPAFDIRTGGVAPGAIACPAGYSLETTSLGGKICSDGTNVWGPFTKAMIQKCLAWDGGAEACNSDRWSRDLALSARGQGPCPFGAVYDKKTGYCTEGIDAFGPFPPSLVAKCEAAGGGPACKTSRWSSSFLRSLLAG